MVLTLRDSAGALPRPKSNTNRKTETQKERGEGKKRNTKTPPICGWWLPGVGLSLGWGEGFRGRDNVIRIGEEMMNLIPQGISLTTLYSHEHAKLTGTVNVSILGRILEFIMDEKRIVLLPHWNTVIPKVWGLWKNFMRCWNRGPQVCLWDVRHVVSVC